MMRISGITIPDNKRIEMALTVIYGIGRSRAHKILDEAKVEYGKLPKDLTTDEENNIRKIIEDNFTIEGNLKRTVSANVKRLKDIGSYKGSRHSRGLPVRGQRTKTNSRTVRGNVRKTMGSGRVIASKT
ncbi:MAG: 30S ribosomal protein S13 [Candidatus Paceibacterota bacterium]